MMGVAGLQGLMAAMDATWPPAAWHRVGPVVVRDGAGGGKRVSAATVDGPWDAAALDAAEAAMRAFGEAPLFRVGAGDDGLDAELSRRGYQRIDPVVIYAVPVGELDAVPDPLTAIPHWPPLQIARALWADGGIGAARMAVMDRAVGPKTALLGRIRDRPSGAAFVALHEAVAMLHALEVAPGLRRQGSARNMVLAAAAWARHVGGERLALAVTEANAPARALYASLGMQAVGRYHYRTR